MEEKLSTLLHVCLLAMVLAVGESTTTVTTQATLELAATMITQATPSASTMVSSTAQSTETAALNMQTTTSSVMPEQSSVETPDNVAATMSYTMTTTGMMYSSSVMPTRNTTTDKVPGAAMSMKKTGVEMQIIAALFAAVLIKYLA